MINNKACEISFELDYPIEIASEGDLDNVSTILFRKPNRQTGPIFQNLASMFNRAMTKNMMEMKSLASEEDISMFGYLRLFSECDLYSRADDPLEYEEIKEYYAQLIDKYLPGKLRFFKPVA